MMDQSFSDMSRPPCPDCGSWHSGGRCGHDRTRPCCFCTRPVGALSTGGPRVCSACEVFGVPPEIFCGRVPARDFHMEAGRFLGEVVLGSLSH